MNFAEWLKDVTTTRKITCDWATVNNVVELKDVVKEYLADAMEEAKYQAEQGRTVMSFYIDSSVGDGRAHDVAHAISASLQLEGLSVPTPIPDLDGDYEIKMSWASS